MICYLYRIKNRLNDKVYFGISNDPQKRFGEHIRGASKNVSLISKAIAKYGKNNFDFEVVCAGPRDYIVDLELKAISHFGALSPDGYNIRVGGEDCGAGHKIQTRSDDKAICVSGFWFPNRRVALNTLGINSKSIYKWKANGTLDKESHLSKDSIMYTSQYVGGFWFDNLNRASEKLNTSVNTLKNRIYKGNLEAETSRSKVKLKENNPMFGRKGKDNPKSKAIRIFGILYDSISDAVRKTTYTKSMIEKRLKKNVEGFEYANPS